MVYNCVINGQFTARRMTGQERFAYELVSVWDKMDIPMNIKLTLVVPLNAKNIPPLKNIEVIRYGKAKGSLWEQTFFTLYILKHKALSLNLCSVMPILKPGIICIHDLSYKVNPTYFKTVYAKISQFWHKIQYHLAWHFSPFILTVSEYSKQQMIDIYHVHKDKIMVVGNGWEHFQRIISDESFINRKLELFQKPYFFSLGSLAPNKNIEWILQVARKHTHYNFLIAGNANLKSYGTDYSETDFPNVHFLGYISDGEIKFLLKHCKAFIFPSFFEGFGVPPLEALSMGTKIIIANSSCLPEIFGKSAHYIDPYNSNINLDELLTQPVESGEAVLEQYRFEKFAPLILDRISSLLKVTTQI